MSTDGTSPEELEAQIQRQREELADTVNQLQSKLDVKSRAREKVVELREQATTAEGRPRPDLVLAAVAVVSLVAGLVLWRRRR